MRKWSLKTRTVIKCDKYPRNGTLIVIKALLHENSMNIVNKQTDRVIPVYPPDFVCRETEGED